MLITDDQSNLAHITEATSKPQMESLARTPSILRVDPLDMSKPLDARLVLADGTVFEGYSFGAKTPVDGEVVFNTGMVGYPESLTDKSYKGQILVLTFPLIGNYGVPGFTRDEFGMMKHFESDNIHVSGLIVTEYNHDPSHYQSILSLGEWLRQHNIPAIYGIDTRRMTQIIRDNGATLGRIEVGEDAKLPLKYLPASSPTSAFQNRIAIEDPNLRNLIAEVSCKKPYTLGSGKYKILVVDCGMKNNITRLMLQYDFTLHIVPWDYDFTSETFDGLFISNGPGDPSLCTVTVNHIRKIMEQDAHEANNSATHKTRPIFGVCMGNQLLSLAAGAKTKKMKFGNRGMNQPVIDLRTNRCYMSSQNHGYCVDGTTLPSGWRELFVNANDNSNEGIIHEILPYFSVQFHPEAQGGPMDTAFLFEDFYFALRDGRLRTLTVPPPPPRSMTRKILLLGSGGLSIGQAGEFDYSGSQAIKALKEEGVTVILVNPNIATVQTSRGMADRVYFYPVTADYVESVIALERPDAIVLQFGGQTALNCGIELADSGILAKYGVEVLGTPVEVIRSTEDREIFSAKLREINEYCAPSATAESVEETLAVAKTLGYPVLLRAAFSLGGLGSGFAGDEDDLRILAERALASSSQVIVDKSLRGWKEVEYEVVRDCRDNCVTICNMENLDPLGIHTGDSIVVAPSQTLSNDDYYRLRAVAIKVVRHLGVVGECNIQYAVDPHSSRYYIIEVNARLSRSSALASKATGYPLAYVAAKLAMGRALTEVRNSMTQVTCACFEPALDYVVIKVPKWDLRKFSKTPTEIGSSMKSVGEVMAIGRTFEETFQKACRMVDGAVTGFDDNPVTREYLEYDEAALDLQLQNPSDRRMFALGAALRRGYSINRINLLTGIDRWFLQKLRNIVAAESFIRTQAFTSASQIPRQILLRAKQLGFSDSQIAGILNSGSFHSHITEDQVREVRIQMNIFPWVKQVDTLAAEFPAYTNYLYTTYHGSSHDVTFHAGPTGGDPSAYSLSHSLKKIKDVKEIPLATAEAVVHATATPSLHFIYSGSMNGVSHLTTTPPYHPTTSSSMTSACNGGPIVVLGGGAYRIGSSCEFDWCAVSCIRTLHACGRSSVVINSNPETVSTDYDECDRLYFDELSLERVLDICTLESTGGVVVSVGGQLPNNLALPLHRRGVPILGTSPESIDMAEDRAKFSALLDRLHIGQPRWKQLQDPDDVISFAEEVGFPVLVRPSYVLSGAAMNIAQDATQLRKYLQQALDVSVTSGTKGPVDHPTSDVLDTIPAPLAATPIAGAPIHSHPTKKTKPLGPVVVCSKFIQDAKEIEYDGVAQNGNIINYAISEHVENAGVHSGDATIVLPAQKLYIETLRRVKKTAAAIAHALNITGCFNIQFMSKNNDIMVIECNLRASRSFPFVSKTFDTDFIATATKAMIGLTVRPSDIRLLDVETVCVKVPMFSFARILGADPVLRVEMASTGEVAAFGSTVHDAFVTAMVSANFRIPRPGQNIVVSIGPVQSKAEFLPSMRLLEELGYILWATEGSAKFYQQQGIKVRELKKPLTNSSTSPPKSQIHSRTPSEGSNALLTEKQDVKLNTTTEHLPLHTETPELSVMDMLRKKQVGLLINVPRSDDSADVTAGFKMRRCAVDFNAPMITNVKIAKMLVESIDILGLASKHGALHPESGRILPAVAPWQSFVQNLTFDQHEHHTK